MDLFPKGHRDVYLPIPSRQLLNYCSQGNTRSKSSTLQAPHVTSPGEPCQRGSKAAGDSIPPSVPADDSCAPCHSVREIYCNTPSASPSPDPRRHPSARKTSELKSAAAAREDTRLFHSEPGPAGDCYGYIPVTTQQFSSRHCSVNPLTSLIPVTSVTPSSQCSCEGFPANPCKFPPKHCLWLFGILGVCLHFIS